MARDTTQDDDFDILPLDIGLEDDEAALGTEDDQDSVARAIYSTRKELFASSLSKAANATTRSTRMWKPITPKDTPAQAEGGGKAPREGQVGMYTEQENDFRGKKGERLPQGLHGLL